jgi:hypothetical protein
MAFNSDTYHHNKARKQAWAELAVARDIKDRAAKGEAYDWELPRIELYARSARSSMRLALHYKRMRDLKRMQ